MDKIYDKCCGIDVHKKLIAACFRYSRKQEVRDFGATTRELLILADWLKEGSCEMAAMESTASYWKPLYSILEESCFQPSYIPDKDQRELRELVRYRKSLAGKRTRELNRLQKMLERASIKLFGTVSDINGKSARSILEYLLTGESIDEARYDEMYKQKVIAHNPKATREQIIDDLNSVMSSLQRQMMKELLIHLDKLNIHIRNLDDETDNFMKPKEKQTSQSIQDATGIGSTSAQAIISVIGTDMERSPTDKHISSWAGMCPGNNESAKKRKSEKTRKGNSILRTTLITYAHAAIKNKKSYFHAQLMRISAHRRTKRTYLAVAHSMFIAVYYILKDSVVFKDLGADYYNQFNKELLINYSLQLGIIV